MYSIGKAKKKALPVYAILLYVLSAAVIFSLIIAYISSCNNKKDNSLTSSKIAYTEAPNHIAQTEVSSAIFQSEKQEEIVSSSIAVSESSMPSSSNSVTSEQNKVELPVSSQTSNLGQPFDVYAEADKWTYNIDKTKPVPLQPAVDNSFFSGAMFVGDSITTGIDLYGVMSNAPVIAYKGINTNDILKKQVIRTASGKVTFLDAMKNYSPKHIFIMMGINGINFQTKDQFINGYSEFVVKVKEQHPDAIIYLQSILPVTAKKQNSNKGFANSKIDSYNLAIAQLAARLDIYYLNVAEAFKDANGNLPAAASSDGVHFGTKYYNRWIEYLKRHTVYVGEIPKEETSSDVAPSSDVESVSSAESSSVIESSNSAEVVTSNVEASSSSAPVTSVADPPSSAPPQSIIESTSSEVSSAVEASSTVSNNAEATSSESTISGDVSSLPETEISSEITTSEKTSSRLVSRPTVSRPAKK